MTSILASSQPSASAAGSQLPRAAKGVGAWAGGIRPSNRAASPRGAAFSTAPSASTTALMPLVVERSTGSPSSIARNRACARCCGGPQLPNQPSLEGLKIYSGRCAASTTCPENTIS